MAQLQDMSDQELQFADMANELVKCKGGVVTFKMYLQYCPDAITYLFDRCLVHEHYEQVYLFL